MCLTMMSFACSSSNHTMNPLQQITQVNPRPSNSSLTCTISLRCGRMSNILSATAISVSRVAHLTMLHLVFSVPCQYLTDHGKIYQWTLSLVSSGQKERMLFG